MKILKRSLLVLLIIVIILVLVLAGYVIFLSVNYYRIEDKTELNITKTLKEGETINNSIATNSEYTALAYNIGFGAYDPEFSFFMDKGVMNDGTKVTGEYAKARDEEAAQKNTDGIIKVSEAEDADFNLYQEVDIDSTRSYHINQEQQIIKSLCTGSSIESTFASNFHSVFLAYPPSDPIGSIESGLLTTGKYSIKESVRRSFPVTDDFINKFFDLDRCFVVNRISVNEKDISHNPHLVLINVHMSAYDEGGLIRKEQMEMLAGVLEEEIKAGNWVVVGGDFNHALYGTEKTFESDQQIPEWVQAFDEESLPEGISIVKADNINDVATVRGSDMPYYGKGVNYMAVIDGFLVSDNVDASAKNIDADFQYSDHNPVLLKFKLK